MERGLNKRGERNHSRDAALSYSEMTERTEREPGHTGLTTTQSWVAKRLSGERSKG